MACTCINTIEEKLTAQYGEIVRVKKGDISDGTTRVMVEGRYHKTKPNGEQEKKWREISMIATYCPFCGKRYKRRARTS